MIVVVVQKQEHVVQKASELNIIYLLMNIPLVVSLISRFHGAQVLDHSSVFLEETFNTSSVRIEIMYLTIYRFRKHRSLVRVKIKLDVNQI